MSKQENEMDALFGGLVLRMRHAKMVLQQEMDRLDAAIAIMAGGPTSECLAIPEKTIDATATTVKRRRSRVAKPTARKPRQKPRPEGVDKTRAVRMAVVKLKGATTGEVAQFVRDMGFEISSSVTSAFLSLGKKKGEYLRKADGTWHYSGGVNGRGSAAK